MRKTTSAVAVALLMVVSYAAGRRHTRQNATPNPNSRRVLYWVDPMHPDYKSDHPGIAPDCGMPLEPVYAEPAPRSQLRKPRFRAGAGGSALTKRKWLVSAFVRVKKSQGRKRSRVSGGGFRKATR